MCKQLSASGGGGAGHGRKHFQALRVTLNGRLPDTPHSDNPTAYSKPCLGNNLSVILYLEATASLASIGGNQSWWNSGTPYQLLIRPVRDTTLAYARSTIVLLLMFVHILII